MEAHVSQQAISFLETGRHDPSMEMIYALSEALGVSAAEMIGENDSKDMKSISSTEEKLLACFRMLNANGREQLLDYADYLLTKPENKKESKSAI